MRAVDLHVHSNYSDGTVSPKDLVSMAVDKGLAAFALTDHDTTKGVDEALLACENVNRTLSCDKHLEVIPGIEISTEFKKKEVHIVGLFIDHKNRELLEFSKIQIEGREERNKKVCELFQQLGINIAYEDMLESYGDCVLTRAHFADKLVELKVVGDRNEAFDRFLGDGKPCHIPRFKVNPAKAIEMIHKAGGIAILAHPILYHLGKEQMNELLEHCCLAGLDGIEATYSTYKPADEREIKSIAKERNLLLSGGSDYHGENKPNIQLGTGLGHLFVPEEYLDKLKKKL